MRRRRKQTDELVEMQMGPMIDMVFLLLVFFMVTAKPVDPENDIKMTLPGTVAQEESVDLPDEQRIVIGQKGEVFLNELQYDRDSRTGDGLPELVGTLSRLRQAAEASRSAVLVTLSPHDDVPHQRIVDVLDACAESGVDGITFADSGGGGS